MNNKFQATTTTEKPIYIILGIIILYFLIEAFAFYFYFMHKISLHTCIIISMILTIVYVPRFYIIKKLKTQDIVKADNNNFIINEEIIPLQEIIDFKIIEKKPQIIFFINKKMVLYNEAEFHLKLNNGYQRNFEVIGSDKITLLKEFFNKVIEINKNKQN